MTVPAYPFAEDLGPINGSNLIFALTYAPIDPTAFLLLWNGQVQRGNYSISGTALTLDGSFTPSGTDVLTAFYTAAGAVPSTGPAGGIGFRFDPEAISIALFMLLAQANFTFNGMDRRGQVTQNVPSANMPYLSLIETGGRQVESQVQGLEKWILDYTVLVYFQPDASPSSIPATVVNAAWKALVEVLRSVPPGVQQTLGGIVDNAWVEGDIEVGTGILGQYAVLALPVKVSSGM